MTKDLKFNGEIFTNAIIDKQQLKIIMSWAFTHFGMTRSTLLADTIKSLGFHYATQAGISISLEDLKIPKLKRRLISAAQEEIKLTEFRYNRGEITSVERFQKVIDTWNVASESIKDSVINYFRENDPLNSVYMMAFSGARGNISQVRQLVGMRGLMSDPQGEIIDIPIQSNFKEGLTLTDYIISSYGARKGLVDTALRTADSGYLTRRLVDVAQELIIQDFDCNTLDGIYIDKYKKTTNFKSSLLGRVVLDTIYHKLTGKVLLDANQVISLEVADKILESGNSSILIRSPLTCLSKYSICQLCYGWSLGYEKLVDLGEAIGIIAAQSIGEPGTQLTMRTFHTGGVFNSELAIQVRSPFQAKIAKFHTNNISPSTNRTRHGDSSIFYEDQTFLSITDSSLNSFRQWVPPYTNIMVKPFDVVRANQIIAEADVTRILNTERAIKDVLSNISGEVVFDTLVIEENIDRQSNKTLLTRSDGIIWVLSGKPIILPPLSIICISLNDVIDHDVVLGKILVFNEHEGFVRISDSEQPNVNIVLASILLEHDYVLKQENSLSSSPFILKTSENEIFSLSVLPGDKVNNQQVIGELIDSQFKTKSGGILKFFNFQVVRRTKNHDGYLIPDIGGTLLWIPEDVYEINKDVSLSLVENHTFISSGTEIAKDTFARNDGLVHIVQQNDIIREIVIKPGSLYKINDLNRGLELDQTILEPGDLLFDNIFIETLSFIELVENFNEILLLVRPVESFVIPEKKSYVRENVNNFDHDSESLFKEWISLDTVRRIPFKDGERIKSLQGINLIKSQLVLKINKTSSFLNADVEFLPTHNNPNEYKLQFVILETLQIQKESFIEDNNLRRKLKFLVQADQFVTANSTIGEIQLFSNFCGRVVNIKADNPNLLQLLLLTDTEKKEFSISEEVPPVVKMGDLIRKNDYLTKLFRSPVTGQILLITASSIVVRVAQPYLISASSLLHVQHHDFIRTGDKLASLFFERIRTGDIVQGLPRIEEILEARKPKESCILAKTPGRLFLFQDTLNTIRLELKSPSGFITDYYPTMTQKVLVKDNVFIQLATPLTDGNINPYELLDLTFSYYKTLFSLYIAAKKSIKHLQIFLVNEIQCVYRSQNIEISDKHLEVIVRQMTLKTRIKDGKDSTLLPGELIELFHIESINQLLIKNGQEPAIYYPILLGITKASLNTESFISAASFQETTRVLTDAAIQGKTDWLKGLKENVIIGRLIPAGTGFNS
jgi:DNA-directed RNA polymerase subunit beta'|tara:strand:+ start:7933 stop:11646 length:3714 start_codon:yes stop_codon:yes gene_type:complete